MTENTAMSSVLRFWQ